MSKDNPLFASTTIDSSTEVGKIIDDISSDVDEVDEVDEMEGDNSKQEEPIAVNSNDKSTQPTAEEYINKFFELTSIYREWKKNGKVTDETATKQQIKNKKTLEQKLKDELLSSDIDHCGLDSIHLFHEGNTLSIECWNKNDKNPKDISVTQYKILLDDKILVEEEIENIKNILNETNYQSEIEYLRNNLLEYQSIIGKETDEYLFNINNISVEELEQKYREKESSYDKLELDIFNKILELIKLQENLNKQYEFLVNYKNLIHAKNELFGKQNTCGDEDDPEMGDIINVHTIDKCLQHCQLKYIDFLNVLNNRYIKLEDKQIEQEKKKALIFDIITLEKQISSLHNTKTDKYKDKYKLQKGALLKVQENGEIYLSIAKSHNKERTNISYCNKITDSETEKQECKNVRNIVYKEGTGHDIIIPILDFIKYYKTITKISKPVIKNGFANEENYEEQDIETYRNIEKTQITKMKYNINENTNYVNNIGIEKKKNMLFKYLNENKDDIKDKIMIFCKNMSYISTEEINEFTDQILESIYKELPMVYATPILQMYIHNYILRFIKHICDNTRIEFNSKTIDEYKTQQDKEKQLENEIKDVKKMLELNRITEDTDNTDDTVQSTNKYSDNSQVITYGKKGLLNIGNTCFMNAAIQVFSNMKPLREFLFGLDATNILDKARDVEDQLNHANSIRIYHLVTHFKNILSNIWSGRSNTFVGAELIRPFRNKLSNFNMGGQHDANEIFMQIYNDIHECLQEPFSVPLRKDNLTSVIILNNGEIASSVKGDENNEITEEFINSPGFSQINLNALSELRRISLYSIISQLFNIIIRRVTINETCDEIEGNLYKINYNVTPSLTLDIPHTERNYWTCPQCETENVFKPNDYTCEACEIELEKQPVIRKAPFYKKYLEELLGFYTSTERLQEGETVRSDVCPESYYNIRETRIVSLPYLLNLSFKRTIIRKGTYIKIDVPVHVPLILDMSDFIESGLFETDRIETLYSLQTIVWHGGYSNKNGGHYKVWSKQGSNWVEFNDSQVSDVIPKIIDLNGKQYIQDYDNSDYIWNIYMVTYARQDIDRFVYKSLNVKAVEVADVPEADDDVPEVEVETKVEEVDDAPDGEVDVPEVEVETKVEEVDDVPEPEPKQVINKPTLIDVPEIDGIDFVMDIEDDEDEDEEIIPDLVEVLISYKTDPNNSKLLLDNTKMKYDEDDNSYYLVDKSGEPISLYMLYNKKYKDVSDGNKVPIDNVIFYYNSNINENMIYGKISELDINSENIKVKDIENKVYEGIYNITMG